MTNANNAPLPIRDIQAYPVSFPVDPKDSVTLGVGRTVKRDAVIVKIVTDSGITGWGEAHHGRCPGAVAHIVNTTLKSAVIGRDAHDVNGIWQRMYQMQLASHGMGAGACLGISGIDMALWVHMPNGQIRPGRHPGEAASGPGTRSTPTAAQKKAGASTGFANGHLPMLQN